ncbi:hypothetical protein CDAR_512321 [Caerostris darwini]|uniref:Uncharacterized protein n=1 Tax=Caerostris darwini TaxID=1538125 RepID=A0AAV4WK71_9ARAC|nr:hypothetical protein CDAR_512321 [Caerostris darwini]
MHGTIKAPRCPSSVFRFCLPSLSAHLHSREICRRFLSSRSPKRVPEKGWRHDDSSPDERLSFGDFQGVMMQRCPYVQRDILAFLPLRLGFVVSCPSVRASFEDVNISTICSRPSNLFHSSM